MLALALVTVGGGLGAPRAQAPVQLQKIFSDSGAFFDTFGNAVDMNGNRIVIGGRISNQVWVFDRTAGPWFEDGSFQSPDAVPGDCFGGAVAVSGDTIVVGAQDDTNEEGTQAGSAYVYVRSPSGWAFQQKLLPAAASSFDAVGWTVDIEGDTIAISSGVESNAYIYGRSGAIWSLVDTIAVGNGGAAQTVALEGDTLLIGSPGSQVGPVLTGAAYVYRNLGGSWTLQQTLLPSAMHALGGFGYRVGISGSALLVTASNEDVPGSHRGAAYIFRDVGTKWVEEARLISPQGEADNNFGWYGDIEADRAVVSESTNTPGQDANSTYLFERCGTTWSSGEQITPSPVVCDGIQCSVPPVLAAPYLVVGVDADDGAVPSSGAAYIYEFPEAPVAYCTGKLNSQGCTPQTGWTGFASISGADDFLVTTFGVLPGKNGIFFFGTNGPGVFPLLGGTLCVTPPLKRSLVQQATGGLGCDASITYLFSQADMVATGLTPGDTAHGQFWLRDPSHPDGTGTGLSNAIAVPIQP